MEQGKDLIRFGQPPTGGKYGYELVADVVNGKFGAVELTFTAAAGATLNRSDLYGFDLQGHVKAAVEAGRAHPRPELSPAARLHLAMENLRHTMTSKNTSETDRLQAVANVYRAAKLAAVSLGAVAEDLGVHKKTLQRWAKQAESAGELSPEDRKW
jgi:hypothetical protein